MEHWQNESDKKKTKILGQKPAPLSLYAPHPPHLHYKQQLTAVYYAI
jgi:hypothetical protein